MKVSKNFRDTEFFCPCGNCEPRMVQQNLVHTLQSLRTNIHSPIHINSGFRCVKHNAEIGGTENSYHTQGLAADIKCINSRQRAKMIQYLSNDIRVRSIGIYKHFLHVDVYGPIEVEVGLKKIWINNDQFH